MEESTKETKRGREHIILRELFFKKQGSILQGFELVWGVDVTGVCAPSD